MKTLQNRNILDFVAIGKKNEECILEKSFDRMSITPKRPKKQTDVKRISSIKKRGPQFDKVMTTERMDSILNGSLEAMFNQLTPEDFASDAENSIDMTLIIENICKKGSNAQSICFEYKEDIRNDKDGPMNDVQMDEFDALENSYVPLDVRLVEDNRNRTSIHESLVANIEEERFSLGIESLLNGTED